MEIPHVHIIKSILQGRCGSSTPAASSSPLNLLHISKLILYIFLLLKSQSSGGRDGTVNRSRRDHEGNSGSNSSSLRRGSGEVKRKLIIV